MLLSAGGHRPHDNTLLTFILKYQAGGGYRIEKSKTFNKEIETSPQIINRNVFNLKEYDERT